MTACPRCAVRWLEISEIAYVHRSPSAAEGGAEILIGADVGLLVAQAQMLDPVFGPGFDRHCMEYRQCSKPDCKTYTSLASIKNAGSEWIRDEVQAQGTPVSASVKIRLI